MRRVIAIVLGCLWGAACIAATATLPPGAVLIDAATPKPDAAALAVDAGAIVSRARGGDIDGAFAQLQAIDDPLRFELTAARVIEALPLSPSAPGYDLLARFEGVPPRVFRRHEETAADWFLPVFDLAAKARGRRDLAVTAGRAQQWLDAFDEDAMQAAKRASDLARAPATHGGPPLPPGTLASHAPGDIDVMRAAKLRALPEAIRRATPAQVARIADAVARRKAPLDSPAQAALARRSGDARMWTLALQHAAPVDVLPLFAQASASLGEKAARAWLADAARQPDYASAAALALARLEAAGAFPAPDQSDTGDARDPRSAGNAGDAADAGDAGDAGKAGDAGGAGGAVDADGVKSAADAASPAALVDALDDPAHGAEAATVLADAPDALAIADRLIADASSGPTRLLNVALMLRLSGSDAARTRLDALRDDTRLPAHVRTELQR